MSDRVRLLFVAPWFLFPRASGGRIRTTDVLRGMKGGAFEITVASPQAIDGIDWSAELESICDRFVSWRDDTKRTTLHRVGWLASRLPVSVALDRSRNARACVARELARAPDVVVLDFVHTAILAPDGRLPMRSVIFTHNVESEIYERNAALARNPLIRAVWRRQCAKMARFEREALGRFDTVVAVSERDGEHFRREFGIAGVRVIPTGVDVDFYGFAPRTGRGDVTRTGGTLVFSGSTERRENIDGLKWLMEEAWAADRRREPEHDARRRRAQSAAAPGRGGGATRLGVDVHGLRRRCPAVHPRRRRLRDPPALRRRHPPEGLRGDGARLSGGLHQSRRRRAAARRRRALRPRRRRPRNSPPPSSVYWATRTCERASRARRASTSPRTSRTASSAAPSKPSASKGSRIGSIGRRGRRHSHHRGR